MGTIEIHGPKVKDIKLAGWGAAILPRVDLVTGKPIAAGAMFSDSLLEFAQQRKRRAFATNMSLIFNCLGGRRDADHAPALHRRPAQGAVAHISGCSSSAPLPSNRRNGSSGRFKPIRSRPDNCMRRTNIPQMVEMIREEKAPPPMAATGGVVGGVPGGIPDRRARPDWRNHQRHLQSCRGSEIRAGRSQGVAKGWLDRVEPAYPTLARVASEQREVVLSAIIDTNGHITNPQLISGHPMLRPPPLLPYRSGITSRTCSMGSL